MIAKIIAASKRARRRLSSLVRLLIYFVVPKPDPELPRVYVAGERLLGAPHTHLLPQAVIPVPARARVWAGALAVGLLGLVRAARGAARAPEKNFEHLSASFHPEDTPRLGENDAQRVAKIRQIVGEVMEEVGLGRHPRVVVVHGDSKHLHAHIVLGTVSLDGRVWNPGHAARRALERAMEEAEIRHGLFRVRQRIAFASEPGRQPDGRARSAAEERVFAQSGERPARERLKPILQKVLAKASGFTEFMMELWKTPVQLVLYRFEDGHLGGAYRLDGETVKASDPGREFSWNALARRLRYAPNNVEHRLWVDIKVNSQRMYEASDSLVLVTQKIGAPIPVRRSLISKMDVREADDGDTEYRWGASHRTVALLEGRGAIRVRGYTRGAVRAALELAARRGWNRVGVRGWGRALAGATLAAAPLGIEVKMPDRRHLPDLGAWRRAQRLRGQAQQPPPTVLPGLEIPKPSPFNRRPKEEKK